MPAEETVDIWDSEPAYPAEKIQLKFWFETAGSWFTSSEQLPDQHDLAVWSAHTQLDPINVQAGQADVAGFYSRVANHTVI